MIQNTISCSSGYAAVHICTQISYEKIKSEDGCLSFIGFENGSYALCQPLELSLDNHTSIEDGDVLYIYRTKRTEPNMYLPLDTETQRRRMELETR